MKILIISGLIVFLFNSCSANYEKAFISKYNLEEFSQFNGVDMSFRGADKQKNLVIYGYAPDFINNTSKVGYYLIRLKEQNYQVVEMKWTLIENNDKADTIKLQHLAQTFIMYRIPRLNVDTAGNVFVYLKDVEKLALVRFANENELQKRSREVKWINIKHNWYKPR
jgi:hypothetical protein